MVGIQKKLVIVSAILSMGMVLFLFGCADIWGPVRSDVGQCDPAADAAFEAGDWQLSLNLHQQLLAHDPGNGMVLFHIGYIYGNLEERQKEIIFYERALASGYDSNDKLYFNLGMAYADSAKWAAARTAIENAITIAPQDADNFFALGLISRQMGRPADALDALNSAIHLEPRHWEARELLVRVYLDLGQWSQARQQLMSLERLDADHPAVKALWDIYNRRRLGDHTLINDPDGTSGR